MIYGFGNSITIQFNFQFMMQSSINNRPTMREHTKNFVKCKQSAMPKATDRTWRQCRTIKLIMHHHFSLCHVNDVRFSITTKIWFSSSIFIWNVSTQFFIAQTTRDVSSNDVSAEKKFISWDFDLFQRMKTKSIDKISRQTSQFERFIDKTDKNPSFCFLSHLPLAYNLMPSCCDIT